jgi:PAS domain S-box-containing protein
VTIPIRILLVEDSKTDAKLVTRELRKLVRPAEVERVDHAAAMRSALQNGAWDIVLSDWSLPKFGALAALEVLKETGRDLPFIIVSGTIGQEAAVDAMRAGARDYVLKDNLGRLVPAIERELREYQVRAAHREDQIRRAAIIDCALDPIIGMDHTGRVTEFNPAAVREFGYSRDEAIGRELADLIIPEPLRDAHRKGLARYLAEGSSVVLGKTIEVIAVHRDGTEIPIELAITQLGTISPPQFMGFIRNLSERSKAEAAVIGRHRAEEALRQSEAQLRQAQKMDAIGRLAGGVAHDFNNMLSVILSYGELLLDSLKPNDPMRADIEEMRKAALRAAGLTRQLLTFSRQQVMEPKVIDLREALASMEKMLCRLLGEDIDLVFSVPQSVGHVKADPSHIEQVILNLAVNARDAMPTGGKLTIELANVFLDSEYALNHWPAQSGRYVMLAVTDTGIGMDRETQARIFEPFFTTKPKGKGTGLGLSTVFGIAQQSGGNIWVYSEPGKGTTFKVYLPRVQADLDMSKPPPSPKTLRGKETVLLVEDEEQVRAVVLSVLRRQGYKVIVAQHAGEALLLCEQHPEPIHLLLTDVVMPQMSGPELAKRLVATRPEIKVICMSGYTDDSIFRHGVLEAGVAFLQKPVTPGTLAKKVREVLDEG